MIKYQQANNLYADGKIGDKTWESMWNKAKKDAEKEKAESVPKVEKLKKYEEPEVAENTTAGSRNNRKIFNPSDIFNIGMAYWGLKKKEQEKGNGYNGHIYSPDGYVEQVERDNELRNREEPVTRVPDGMAEYLEFGENYD